jgi:hypothetical protein
MDMDNAAAYLAGSILYGLGTVFCIACAVAVNNLLAKYWKPVRVFTADSFNPFNNAPRYATEEELARIAPHLEEKTEPAKKK